MSFKEIDLSTFVDINTSEETQPSSITAETDFNFVNFAKLLLYRNVDIIAYNDLQSITDESPEPNRTTPAMLEQRLDSMEFRRWNGKIVAVKLPRTLTEQCPDNVIGPGAYSKHMTDTSFAIQLMTYNPLCDHPNIIKLLGLSFHEPFVSDLPIPILVFDTTNNNYPNLKIFIESPERPRPLRLQCLFALISDVADGITVLHDFGIDHSHIIPENILLFDDAKSGRLLAKLSNFGPSCDQVCHDPPIVYAERWLPPDYKSYTEKAHKQSINIYSFGRVGV